MNRAERRRQARTPVADNPFQVPVVLNLSDTTKVSKDIGLKVGQLEAWADIQREEQRKAFTKEFNTRLEQAEDFIGLANILISVKAINLTWGYKQAIGRYVNNLDKAHEYIRQVGVRKAFIDLNKEYGLDLEFDAFEIEDFIKGAETLNLVPTGQWKAILKQLRFTERNGTVYDKNGQRIFEYDNEVDKAQLYDVFSGVLWGRDHYGIK